MMFCKQLKEVRVVLRDVDFKLHERFAGDTRSLVAVYAVDWIVSPAQSTFFPFPMSKRCV